VIYNNGGDVFRECYVLDYETGGFCTGLSNLGPATIDCENDLIGEVGMPGYNTELEILDAY
jgi:hypothetical protein